MRLVRAPKGALREAGAAARSSSPSAEGPPTMSRLFLLRHAKAGWAEPGMRDFDRPLEPVGRTDADAIGQVMTANAYIPDLVLCSSARRARETLDWIARHVGDGRVVFSDSLYSTDAAGYVDFIRATADGDSVLLVGHNPMMEDVAMALSGDGEGRARSTLNSGFPTSALAVIRFPGELAETAPGKGYLEAFLTPADL
jgi:phosphohistidine phosphatase